MRSYATVLFACFALAACHRAPPRPAQANVVKRVVSLAPSSTEILFAVGAGDLVVGVDQFSDWPPAARALPKVGTELQPTLERLVALRPDVVFIASSANSRELIDQLARLHIRSFASHAETLDDVFRDISGIGATVGHAAEAARLVDGMQARLAAVRARVAGKPRPRTLVVVWPDPLTVAGGTNFVHQALVTAGGDNVTADSPLPYPQYSLERLLARAPEVIVVGAHDGQPSPAPLYRLTMVPAVREHRVHVVDANLLFRPGPRLVDGIEELAKVLHP